MNEIERIVERINNGTEVGVMSCGEQIAAAFIFNRMDWLPPSYTHPMDALDRLGSNWREVMMDYWVTVNRS